MPLNEQYLQLIAKTVDCAAEREALERFSNLYDILIRTNEKINITSLTSPIDVVLKHFIDSLTLFTLPLFRRIVEGESSLCDIGCGGGFPGLPIACVQPEKKITMIDSTEKKILALKENAEAMKLGSVTALWGRGEELAAFKGGVHREKYDLCVSRAVASLPVLCELCLPFVRPGGYFVAMKGQKAAEEVEAAKKAIPMLGGVLEEVFPVKLDLSKVSLDGFSPEEKEKIEAFFGANRYLVVIRKKAKIQPIYPRKWAQMTKKPL